MRHWIGESACAMRCSHVTFVAPSSVHVQTLLTANLECGVEKAKYKTEEKPRHPKIVELN